MENNIANLHLLALSLKFKGDWNSIYNAISKKQKVNDDELEKAKNFKEEYITILDDNYPKYYKDVSNPPFILYYKGNISLLNYPKLITVVGTRHPSYYGLTMTENIVKGLGENNVGIVSGLALGIDQKAHQTCLDNNIPTIGILADGLDKIYPKSNKQLADNIVNYGGLLISEYPPGIEASQDKFGFRNRLVAALSKGVLVSEAYERSGTMITLKYALFMGKDVFVVPHNVISNTINNKWIKEGAYLVENAEDIIENVNF